MATTILGSNPKWFPHNRPLHDVLVQSPVKGIRPPGEGLHPSTSESVELSVWQVVNAELKGFESEHHRFWWERHTGKALAVLLYNAGYTADLQHRDLKFFAQVVAPHLGVSRAAAGGSTLLQWPSFMTDNGNPVELSWDWGTSDKRPTIRYSIEPIGLHAGTTLDPGNLDAAPSLHRQLVQTLPQVRQEWHHHFLEFFNGCKGAKSGFVKDAADHNTSIFYAFDLSPTEVTAKVYYFPKFRANILNQSKLDVLAQGIRTAPGCTEENLKAWSVFQEFASEPCNQTLEHEMLAIDLIDPLKSRLKIYLRCRETTFDSVIRIMTLGGRINNPCLYRGLIDLARLWNALFDVDVPLDQPLGETAHRTAGILYNIEFKLGDRFPAAKIYMPVRHYSRSDDAIIRGLDKYFSYHRRGKYMNDYIRTMNALFSADSLRAKSGVQTYVGVSIRPDGTLRVVSYFKPEIPQNLFST